MCRIEWHSIVPGLATLLSLGHWKGSDWVLGKERYKRLTGFQDMIRHKVKLLKYVEIARTYQETTINSHKPPMSVHGGVQPLATNGVSSNQQPADSHTAAGICEGWDSVCLWHLPLCPSPQHLGMNILPQNPKGLVRFGFVVLHSSFFFSWRLID